MRQPHIHRSTGPCRACLEQEEHILALEAKLAVAVPPRPVVTEPEAEATEDELQEIAAAMFRIDAPRYGNELQSFDDIAEWEKAKHARSAGVAVRVWELLKARRQPTAKVA